MEEQTQSNTTYKALINLKVVYDK